MRKRMTGKEVRKITKSINKEYKKRKDALNDNAKNTKYLIKEIKIIERQRKKAIDRLEKAYKKIKE